MYTKTDCIYCSIHTHKTCFTVDIDCVLCSDLFHLECSLFIFLGINTPTAFTKNYPLLRRLSPPSSAISRPSLPVPCITRVVRKCLETVHHYYLSRVMEKDVLLHTSPSRHLPRWRSLARCWLLLSGGVQQLQTVVKRGTVGKLSGFTTLYNLDLS